MILVPADADPERFDAFVAHITQKIKADGEDGFCLIMPETCPPECWYNAVERQTQHLKPFTPGE
jgi:hypothetical protein